MTPRSDTLQTHTTDSRNISNWDHDPFHDGFLPNLQAESRDRGRTLSGPHKTSQSVASQTAHRLFPSTCLPAKCSLTFTLFRVLTATTLPEAKHPVLVTLDSSPSSSPELTTMAGLYTILLLLTLAWCLRWYMPTGRRGLGETPIADLIVGMILALRSHYDVALTVAAHRNNARFTKHAQNTE
ncbi:hypothetical protein EDD18DRAFT_431755 [Armillaria luteobubalina]|uniref:Uncharacterized protein n=1 Tax=Armillaria luteobubalina TaxID=153913 RepID=A0AA39PYX5_9AGAR|nr:hypothetical protein EDD18DRAFT_431736 [Armillaria luteobubalina]KAK0493150.1 hypothetical protein EDD18DRAFT_431755 [Armillaria luteobubalina]